MFIELQNNHLAYTAGQKIDGTVHVNLTQPVVDHDITIGLYGQEKVSFSKSHVNSSSKRTLTRTAHYRGEHPIITAEFKLTKFTDGPPHPGQYSYPFQLAIPDWLPDSLIFEGERECA